MSSIAPILKEHGVRLVGIGLGYNSLEGFIKGGYWRENELYVDEEKKFYSSLKLGKGTMASVFSKEVAKENKKTKEANIDGNLSGDGMQLGGTYIVEQGGNVIYEFQQKHFGEHPEILDLLKALKIDENEFESRITEFKQGELEKGE